MKVEMDIFTKYLFDDLNAGDYFSVCALEDDALLSGVYMKVSPTVSHEIVNGKYTYAVSIKTGTLVVFDSKTPIFRVNTVLSIIGIEY